MTVATTKLTHMWNVSHWFGAYNASTSTVLPANLFLVQDATKAPVGGRPVAVLPTTSSTILAQMVLGISPATGRTLGFIDLAQSDGDVVAAIASGAVTCGDSLTIDTAAGHEGQAKTTTVDGVTTTTLIVGQAMEDAADGAVFYVKLQITRA